MSGPQDSPNDPINYASNGQLVHTENRTTNLLELNTKLSSVRPTTRPASTAPAY